MRRGSPSAVVTQFPDVARKRNASGALRSLALAEMQALHSQIAGSNFLIAFADAAGFVLDTLSDHVFADSDAGRAIIPGSVWLESARGTNALGLALAAEAPAAVYGREHFFASHGSLSCMAAPIVDRAASWSACLPPRALTRRVSSTHTLWCAWPPSRWRTV